MTTTDNLKFLLLQLHIIIIIVIFNLAKCTRVRLGEGVTYFYLVLNESEIPRDVKLKYLRAIREFSLKWNTHDANVVGKASKLVVLIGEP